MQTRDVTIIRLPITISDSYYVRQEKLAIKEQYHATCAVINNNKITKTLPNLCQKSNNYNVTLCDITV